MDSVRYHASDGGQANILRDGTIPQHLLDVTYYQAPGSTSLSMTNSVSFAGLTYTAACITHMFHGGAADNTQL